MALLQSAWATGDKLLPKPALSGTATVLDVSYTVAAGLAAGDIIEMLPLPAGVEIVDVLLLTDDLDSNATPTLALDVGLVSGDAGEADNARTCGNEFFAADTTARAGGVARMSRIGGFRVSRSDMDRGIGIKVATAAATLAVGGKLGLRVTVKA